MACNGRCGTKCARLVDHNGVPLETVNGVTVVPTGGTPIKSAPGSTITVTEELDADGFVVAYLIS